MSHGFFFLSRLKDRTTSEVLSSNYWMPYPKVAEGLAVPNLAISSVEEDTTGCNVDTTVFAGGCFKLVIQTDTPAIYTLLEAIGKHPTKAKLQNPPIEVSKLHKMCRSTDFEALKLRCVGLGEKTKEKNKNKKHVVLTCRELTKVLGLGRS